MVGNGKQLNCNGQCTNLPLTLDHIKFLIFYILPVSGADKVLGVQRLKTLEPMITNYSDLTMHFTWKGMEMLLTGISYANVKEISST